MGGPTLSQQSEYGPRKQISTYTPLSILLQRAVRYKPDLFIIDGMLPKMTGYQLVAMLKKNRTLLNAPIIFISGRASARDKQYVTKLGVQHFLAKPPRSASRRNRVPSSSVSS